MLPHEPPSSQPVTSQFLSYWLMLFTVRCTVSVLSSATRMVSVLPAGPTLIVALPELPSGRSPIHISFDTSLGINSTIASPSHAIAFLSASLPRPYCASLDSTTRMKVCTPKNACETTYGFRRRFSSFQSILVFTRRFPRRPSSWFRRRRS